MKECDDIYYRCRMERFRSNVRHRCVPLFLFVLLFSVHRKMVIVKSASLILTIMHANDNIMFIMEDTITHGISILHVCFFN